MCGYIERERKRERGREIKKKSKGYRHVERRMEKINRKGSK